MGRRPIFYNALMLTGVNLLLRLVSTSFQVFLSGRVGAAGIGLMQLVMSVSMMSMTAGNAGVRTASMYLTAEELGKKRPQNVSWILSGCVMYSLIFSLSVAAAVFGFAPQIAARWIGDMRTVSSIRLFAAFLPVSCLSGVMVGYFTAANRIGALAAVEVVEQFCSMGFTACALLFWAGNDLARACQSVVLGGCAGSGLTLCSLVVLRVLERPRTGVRISVARRLTTVALPLAVADDLKVGITTLENMMVPKRLARYYEPGEAMAQFGTVCGMVFPVLMFPAAILYGLADLLIPEMARCNASGSQTRIHYLTRRSLRLALIYGAVCGGILFLMAEPLSLSIYRSNRAGQYLRWFSLLAPMLYSDAIIDAINKGRGKQKICVRINIFTSVLDVAGLYILLPLWGMEGYFISFFISHGVNIILSLTLLLRTSGIAIPLSVPMRTVAVMGGGIIVAEMVPFFWMKGLIFLVICFCGLYLTGVISGEDLIWVIDLTGVRKKRKNFDFLQNNI